MTSKTVEQPLILRSDLGLSILGSGSPPSTLLAALGYRPHLLGLCSVRRIIDKRDELLEPPRDGCPVFDPEAPLLLGAGASPAQAGERKRIVRDWVKVTWLGYSMLHATWVPTSVVVASHGRALHSMMCASLVDEKASFFHPCAADGVFCGAGGVVKIDNSADGEGTKRRGKQQASLLSVPFTVADRPVGSGEDELLYDVDALGSAGNAAAGSGSSMHSMFSLDLGKDMARALAYVPDMAALERRAQETRGKGSSASALTHAMEAAVRGCPWWSSASAGAASSGDGEIMFIEDKDGNEVMVDEDSHRSLRDMRAPSAASVRAVTSRWRSQRSMGQRMLQQWAEQSAGVDESGTSLLVGKRTRDEGNDDGSDDDSTNGDEAADAAATVPHSILSHRIRLVPLEKVRAFYQSVGGGAASESSSGAGVSSSSSSSSSSADAAPGSFEAALSAAGLRTGPDLDPLRVGAAIDELGTDADLDPATGRPRQYVYCLELLVTWKGCGYGEASWELACDPALAAAADAAVAARFPHAKPVREMLRVYLGTLTPPTAKAVKVAEYHATEAVKGPPPPVGYGGPRGDGDSASWSDPFAGGRTITFANGAQLLPYQCTGVARMLQSLRRGSGCGGLILADEMGLGEFAPR